MARRVIHGDMLQELPKLAADGERFHSVVTDPPYHLTQAGKSTMHDKTWQEPNALQFKRLTTGFMGKQWDGGDIAFRPETWRAVFDVMLPGAYLVAFGGTRTFHRMACAIEDAGFEIRDTLCWLYGSGFPKSLDVSKAIDKARIEDEGPVRAICRALRVAMDSRALKSHHMTAWFNDCHPRLIDHWAARDTDSQPALPTWDQWLVLRNILGLGAELDCEVWRLNGRKGQPGAAWQQADVTGEYDGTPGGFGDHRFSVRDTKKRAPSPEAEQWAGWGTALKPAFEPIILARKPLRGTVAANVLAHGTGAINVDACRVAGAKPVMERTATIVAANCMSGVSTGARSTGAIDTTTGRWPANVLHDGSDEVEAAFAAFGNSESSSHTRHNQVSLGSSSGGIYGTASGFNGNGIADTGSASRFFYCAKADRGDRADSRHPTVKPVSLLRWLVRLVCPPGGTVLDPFAGSGTTGEAAMLEGFDAVLIERDAQHAADIRHRIKRWSGLDAPLFAEVAD